MHKYLKVAVKNGYAYDYDPHVEYQLCAVIARGGTILSVGYNKSQTNRFVEHYTDLIKGPDRNYNMSTHAEMDAVLSVRSKTDLRGAKIYVVRIRPPGTKEGHKVGMARPCEICQNVLYAYGIRRAYYTIDDNNYGVMKIAQDKTQSDQTICVGEK